MRNPNRIKNVLEVLGAFWRANPDLRLGQLLSNLMPDRFLRADAEGFHFADTFNIEDDELEAIIRDELLKLKLQRNA